jgi:hypothetical protein
MYAYAGFPRSLNGINAFMAVMDERQAKGIKDEMGKEASPLPTDMNKDEYGAKVRARLAGREMIPPPSGYQLFTPVIDTFLKGHFSVAIPRKCSYGNQVRGQTEVKRAPADSECIQSTIRRSPDEIHRADRQPK